MNPAQKFTLNPEYRVEKFDNEILLYAVSSTKGIYLNETAWLVWEMCANDHSAADIIELLAQAYPPQRATIPEDVSAAIRSLVDSGALIVRDD